jgi:hypothetical protein
MYKGQPVPRTRAQDARVRSTRKAPVPYLYVYERPRVLGKATSALPSDSGSGAELDLGMHDYSLVFQQLFEKTLPNLANACAHGDTDARWPQRRRSSGATYVGHGRGGNRVARNRGCGAAGAGGRAGRPGARWC